jgi:antitoxin component YwqK of YwqJK toxin-antitoxin module
MIKARLIILKNTNELNMKRIHLMFLFAVLIFSCKENNSQTAKDSASVQHDTINTTKMFESHAKKDSVISNGEYIQYYKNGVTKMRGMMKDGKRDGLWKSFYDNGLPWSETTFKDGKKHGRTTTWFENGKKRYEGSYDEDAESGKWTFWNEEGVIVSRPDYEKK